MKERHFTLVELIVVIVVLAVVVVAAILFIQRRNARNYALYIDCYQNNMKPISQALLMYASDNRAYLPDKSLEQLVNYGITKDNLSCPAAKIKDNSYIYNPGLYFNDLTPEDIVVQDALPHPRHGINTVTFP